LEVEGFFLTQRRRGAEISAEFGWSVETGWASGALSFANGTAFRIRSCGLCGLEVGFRGEIRPAILRSVAEMVVCGSFAAAFAVAASGDFGG
jgi:hypothetical protein